MRADHDRMEELVAAYALDACDDAEREEVEVHLDGCPSCRALARRLSRTVAALPLAVDPVRPPDQLRDRILAAATASLAPGHAPEPDAEADTPNVLTFPRAEPSRRPRRRIPLHWAAVAVLAVALAGLGAWNVILDQSLNAPPARYSLVGTGTLAGASGTVTEFRRQDAALVALAGMPPPPAGKVYQLWLIDASGRSSSAGTFTPSADGTARVGVDRPMSGVKTVAVTAEAGPTGARAPTGKPELAGQVGG
jgi:anti-sigma-K factor RskA